MNKKNSWAFKVASPELSEAIQLVAFSYGYKWQGWQDQLEVIFKDCKYLIFNYKEKTITWTNCESTVLAYTDKTVTSFEDAIKLLQSPPTNFVRVKDFANICENGIIEFDYPVKALTSNDINQINEARNKILNKTSVKKRMLPTVIFTYTSKHSGKKDRHVAVTNMQDGYIEGLDQDDNYNFKSFLLEKVSGLIEMTGFVEE